MRRDLQDSVSDTLGKRTCSKNAAKSSEETLGESWRLS